MKKTLSVLALFLAALFVLPAAADGLLPVARRETNLASPLAIVRELTGEDAYRAVLGGGDAPAIILVDAADVSDFGEFFAACETAVTIPNVRVTTEDQVAALADAADAAGFRDLSVISGDPALLSLARERSKMTRTGLEVTLPSAAITSKEANETRLAVRSAPATFCVIGPETATPENVRALQSLALAVWVRLDSVDPSGILAAVASGCNGIIGEDDREIAGVINRFCDGGTLARTPLFIGHRGYESRAPENTIAAFRYALDNGADIFEIDVDITKDGEVVVMHDGSIGRTTDYDGPLSIGEMTLEEIKSYNIVSGMYYPGEYKVGQVTDLKVPTLREVFELLAGYPGRRVFIELKGSSSECVAEVARLVREYDIEDQVDVISFNGDLLREMVKETNLPGMSTGYLGGAKSLASAHEHTLKELYDALSAAQGVSGTVNYSSVSTYRFMEAANDRGMTVWPWTYGRYTNDAAFFYGAAGITTSDVGWAADMFRSVSADDVTVGVGRKVEAAATAVTYRGESVPVPAGKISVKIVNGDAITTGNGRITGVAEGTATALFSVSAKTADGSDYKLVTGPVTVTVTADGPGVDPSEPEIDPVDPVPVRPEGKELFVSHLNSYNEYMNDGMIVTNTGWAENVLSLEGTIPRIMRRYVLYCVENVDGKYVATKYLTGDAAANCPAPDPADGFLLLFCPTNRSYEDAKGGKLLGYELVPDGYRLWDGFDFDTMTDPDSARRLIAVRRENADGFDDVDDGAYYADPVTWAVYMGVTAGTGATTFSPEDGCTRGQVVTFLWRAAGEPEPTGAENPFRDVGEDDYFRKAVLWAVENGITKGTGKTTFSPDDVCTRGQIVTFLHRSAGSPAPEETDDPFDDVKTDDYFRDAVLWAVSKDITKGTSKNRFSPSETCTRGQIVTFLYRNATN